MACRYWNSLTWDNTGCTLIGFDKTHVKCECDHLTAFSPSFVTPPVEVAKEELPDKYIKPKMKILVKLFSMIF